MSISRKTFGEFAEFRNGVNYVAGDRGETVKVVGVGDFQNKSELSSFDNLAQVTLRGPLLPEDELRDGDLLFVRSNGNKHFIGRSIVVRNPPSGITFSGFTIRARVNHDVVLPEFVAQLFRGDTIRNHILMSGGGNGNIANLNQELLRSLELKVPDIYSQRRMLSLAAVWDDAVEKNERLIAAKEKQKTGSAAALMSGKRRFKGFKQPWKKWNLGELFQERVEIGRLDLPLLSITREEGIIPRSDVGRKDSSSEDKSKYLRICPGDIGYNTMRMWQGVSALSRYEGLVSPAYTICTPGPDIDGKFASYLFKLPAVVNLFYRYSQGLTSDTWNLKFHHFAEIKVTIPPIDEQVAIASFLSGLDDESAVLKKTKEALIRQKRGLMQKLLTGEWRVPLSSERAATA